MRGRFLAALAIGLALMGALATDASAQRRDRDRDLVFLGEKVVGFGIDRDVLRISQAEDWYRTRSFRALHFFADRNDVYMLSVRLVYFNGFSEDLRIDQLIRQGDYLPIDLRGERSFIRAIEMTYRSRPNFRGEAVIQVYGEPARFGGPRPGGPRPEVGVSGGSGGGGRDWEELGCKDVALFGKDNDVIRVGRREGRFKAIRLYARGADVEMINLRVIYSNGEPDNLDVRRVLRQGDRTPPLDLRGWERSIDRIEMRYRTIPNFKGLARVCAEGLQ
jgi:hypothetical protein